MTEGSHPFCAMIVHGKGFPETRMPRIALADGPGKPLTGDDAAGKAPPLSEASLSRNMFELSDGYRIVWDRPAALVAGRLTSFQFRVEDREGKPATDMELYMGMQGHDAFIKTDRSVLAHIHPSATVPI